jgi:hypothetical protein
MPKKTITLIRGTPYDVNIESDTSLHVVLPLNNIKKDSSNPDIYICDNRNKECTITVQSRSDIKVNTISGKTMPVVIDGSNTNNDSFFESKEQEAAADAAEAAEEEEEEEVATPPAPAAAAAAAPPKAPANANSCLSINRHLYDNNSCYMDSVMFALFSFPSTFVTKYILNADINAIETKIIQELYLQKMRNIMDEVTHKPDNESEESRSERVKQFITDYEQGFAHPYSSVESRMRIQREIEQDATKIIEYVKRVKTMLDEINNQLRGTKSINRCLPLRSILLRGPFTVLDGRYDYSEIQENVTRSWGENSNKLSDQVKAQRLANAITAKRFSTGKMEDADEFLQAIFKTFFIETIEEKTEKQYYNRSNNFLKNNYQTHYTGPLIQFSSSKLHNNNFIMIQTDETSIQPLVELPAAVKYTEKKTYKVIDDEQEEYNKYMIIKIDRTIDRIDVNVDIPETLRIREKGSVLSLNHIVVRLISPHLHFVVYFRCNNNWYMYNDIDAKIIPCGTFDNLKKTHTDVTHKSMLLFYNGSANILAKSAAK